MLRNLGELQTALSEYLDGDRVLDQHMLFPFCSEIMSKFPKQLRSKLGTRFDKVNRPVISREVIEALSNAFMKPGSNGIKPMRNISETDKSFSHNYINDSNKYLEEFMDWIKLNTESNLFIVSHGIFMNKLLKKLLGEENSVDIDNLDIIHITIDDNATDIDFKFKALYRWQTKYSVEQKIMPQVNTNNANNILPKRDEKLRHIFIARHCTACHNHPYATLFYKQFYKSYGEWAMCFKETKEEISSRAPILLDLLTKYGD